tara:strand:+ start:314 stop:1111 length:798 start_codon:yes stop_codon:yes gene_type:complete
MRHAALVLALVLSASSASGQIERQLWSLWTNHLAQTEASARVIEQCHAFEAANRAVPLVNVARGICAWHELRRGDHGAARLHYRKMESEVADPLPAAGNAMALRWTTRMDLSTVRGALQEYYKDKLEYPANLETLAGYSPAGDFPAADRYGKPWLYLRMPMHRARKITDQRYSISSSAMRRTSDLNRELKQAYAHDFKPTFVKNLPSVGGPAFMRFVNAAGREKRTHDLLFGKSDPKMPNVRLAYVGKAILVLSNGDYWFIVLRR